MLRSKTRTRNPRTGNALRHGPSGTAPGDQPDNGGPGQRGAPDTPVPVRGLGSGRQRLRDEGDADTQGDAARRRRPPFAEGADGQAGALRHPEEGVQEQQGGGGEDAATHAAPARIQVCRVLQAHLCRVEVRVSGGPLCEFVFVLFTEY